jgi:hypothetical protein
MKAWFIYLLAQKTTILLKKRRRIRTQLFDQK